MTQNRLVIGLHENVWLKRCAYFQHTLDAVLADMHVTIEAATENPMSMRYNVPTIHAWLANGVQISHLVRI